jgi:hypothetical protein
VWINAIRHQHSSDGAYGRDGIAKKQQQEENRCKNGKTSNYPDPKRHCERGTSGENGGASERD